MIRCLLEHPADPEDAPAGTAPAEKTAVAFRWMDVSQPQPGELDQLAAEFGLSHYAVKDSLEPDHLPKFEVTPGYRFLIVRFFSPKNGPNPHSIQDMTSKIAFFHNDNFLITIHRQPLSFIDEIKAKYVDTGYVTSTAAAVVKVIWYVLHSYEVEAQALVGQVDTLEQRTFLKERMPDLQQRLYYLKRRVSVCQRLLFVTRDVLAKLTTTPQDAASLQDVRDLHTKLEVAYSQLLENVNNLLNVYISLSAQRTNDVVKLLTIFSVFFMPLTFIAGIYGMNFEYMPELAQKWGYPAVLGLMAAVSAGIYVWFKRKKWL